MCYDANNMRSDIEYIYGKHAVREVLNERPDVVAEVYAAANFSDGSILDLVDSSHTPLKVLNEKIHHAVSQVRQLIKESSLVFYRPV
jgi:tRNA G18 (ribose-2'-O)-methylase SpoU